MDEEKRDVVSDTSNDSNTEPISNRNQNTDGSISVLDFITFDIPTHIEKLWIEVKGLTDENKRIRTQIEELRRANKETGEAMYGVIEDLRGLVIANERAASESRRLIRRVAKDLLNVALDE